MSNDLTTLNGSLQEIIDRLESNLQAKGVDVTYDSTTGILGLVDEIQNISQSGGGVPCYNVSFTPNTWDYTDYDFSIDSHYTNLEIYLEYQYQAYSGTVTISDGTNSYQVTTDSNGIGKLKVTGITANATTFTASYNNTTSDTTIVNKTNFILLDKCNSSSGLTNYGSSVPTYKSSSGSPSCTLSYDSGMGTYKIVASNTSTSYYSMIPVISTQDKTNYVAEIKIYDNKRSSNSECGLFVRDSVSTSTSTYGVGADMNDYANNFYIRRQSQSSTSTSVTTNSNETLGQHKWYKLVMIVTDTGISAKWYNSSDELIGENSYNQTISNKQLGIWLRGGSTANTTYYLKEFKVRSLS